MVVNSCPSLTEDDEKSLRAKKLTQDQFCPESRHVLQEGHMDLGEIMN